MRKSTLLLAPFLGALLLPLLAAPARADHQDVRVPNLVGQPGEIAAAQLESIGLTPVPYEVADAPPGQVAEQEPAAGELVPTGTEVIFRVGVLLRIDTRVPDVVGWTSDRALRALEGVYDVQVEEVRGPRASRGKVLETIPAPGGYLPYRGAIVLRVGVVRRTILVPRVTGLAYSDAERLLVGLGFVPAPSFLAARAEPWTVIRQNPAAGTQADPGTSVELQVALPPRPAPGIRVPNLHGMPEAQAVQVLTALGLGRRTHHAPSPFPTGRVYRQEPEAGGSVPPGTAVEIWVASRPFGGRLRRGAVAVPSVVGSDPAQARVRLAAAGLDALVVEVDAPGRPLDQVVTQEPAAGARVPIGTPIELRIPAVAEMPDVVGMGPEQAQQTLAAVGLTVQMEGRTGGRVVVGAQEPPPGTRLAKGSSVRLVLSANPGMRLVVVPDLVGRTMDEAQALLTQAGLTGAFTGPPLRPGQTARIVSQDPAAGTRVARGAQVQATFAVVRRSP